MQTDTGWVDITYDYDSSKEYPMQFNKGVELNGKLYTISGHRSMWRYDGSWKRMARLPIPSWVQWGDKHFTRLLDRGLRMSGLNIYEVNDESIVKQIQKDTANAAQELVEAAKLHSGHIVVIGCSTSETLGEQVGSHSVPEVGKAILAGLESVFAPLGIYIAAQCCEHLNRAIIVERAAVPNAEIVNVVPQPKAGGSFATACYAAFQCPVALEHIKADAGLDIGGTLIGMHLKEVAVPVRLKQNRIGKALLIAARTRPKFIGGERAHYDESLKDGFPA